MAGTGVTLYSTTSAGNKTVIGTIDWREDVYMPSQINDNVGQIMADIRAMANAVATGWIEIGDGDGTYTATYVSATSFRFDGVNVATYYSAGMRVRVVAPTPGTIDGTITSSTFSTHTTLTVAWDSGSLSNEAITSVSLGIGSVASATALASTPTSYRNILGRNGGLEVWQRGAGGNALFAMAASSPRYTADGWYAFNGANQACGVFQLAGFTTGSRFSLCLQRNPGQTGVAPMALEYPLDSDEIAMMRGSIVTLSLTLKVDANWSPASGNMSIQLRQGTGSPARATSGFTGMSAAIGVTQALTTTATRYSFTSVSVIPANATQASVYLEWTPVGTAGAADQFYIDDVQLVTGAQATPFERRPFESELAACRRHYQKSFAYQTAPAAGGSILDNVQTFTQAVAASTLMYTDTVRLGVPMRVNATFVLFNPSVASAEMQNLTTATSCTATVAWIDGPSVISFRTTAPAGSAAGNLLALHWTADAGI